MKGELINVKGEIIPVSVFTIPTPVRGFGWAVRTTFAAARRFWKDMEEVRWLAWEGTKKAGILAGRLGLKAGLGALHIAVNAAIITRKTVPMLWRAGKKAVSGLWQKGKKTIPAIWRKATAGFKAFVGRAKNIGEAIGEGTLWLASNVAGGLMILTLLLAKGIGAVLDAGCSGVQEARDGLVSAWKFREELIAEWA